MAAITPNAPTNDILKGIEGNQRWAVTTLAYAFPTAGELASVDSSETLGANSALAATSPFGLAVLEAFAQYERVTNLRFVKAASLAAADIRIVGNDFAARPEFNGFGDYPGGNKKGGVFSSQYEATVSLSTTAKDSLGTVIEAMGVEPGGSNFRQLLALHEIGHALGLAHPHDEDLGTAKIAEPNDPVTHNPTATDLPLDNERYTVMSYERGGLDANVLLTYGHAASPSPLDIAALQHMYGANPSANPGDTTYRLLNPQGGLLDLDGSDGTVQVARALYTIWDTGGTDTIAYGGSFAAYINLNQATLTRSDSVADQRWIEAVRASARYGELPNEVKQDIANPDFHAGGFQSRVLFPGGPVAGGFAIANGGAATTIENAGGGSGADVLIGNAAANRLSGREAKDLLAGAAGGDTLEGGSGDDELIGGEGDDAIDGGLGTDTAVYSGLCSEYDFTRDPVTGEVLIVHARGPLPIDGADRLKDVEFAKFETGTIDLRHDPLGCPPLDVILLVDLSGSFVDDLANFRASVGALVKAAQLLDPRAQFALASFVDKPGPLFAGDYTYKANMPLTADVGTLQFAVDNLRTFFGGDEPESQLVGIYMAAKGVGLNLRPDSRKIIVVATDASSHAAADYGLSDAEVRKFLADEEIKVVGGGSDLPSTLPSLDGRDPGSPDGEALAAAAKAALDASGALPIFAVTNGVLPAYEALAAVYGRGLGVLLAEDSANLGDAFRLGLARLQGSLTQPATDGPDTLIGRDDLADVLFGGPADDRIEGRDRGDSLDGGDGADLILGQGGDDRIDAGSGADFVDGGAGDDILVGGFGNDGLVGGAGQDTADYSQNGPAQRLLAFLDLGAARDGSGGVDGLVAIEHVTGGAGEDAVVGDANGNRLLGGGSQDLLFGGAFAADGAFAPGSGADTLDGGAGPDGLWGADGPDALGGDAGSDGLVGGAGNDTLEGGADTDFLFGGDFAVPSGAFLPGSGDDVLKGGDGGDGLWGFDGADVLEGEAGNDYVEGGAGNDSLAGGADSDFLLGQEGGDTVGGGTGFDYLYGGAGADTFVFAKGDGADWALDFKAAEGDKLRLVGFGFASFAELRPLLNDYSTPGAPATEFNALNAATNTFDEIILFGVAPGDLEGLVAFA